MSGIYPAQITKTIYESLPVNCPTPSISQFCLNRDSHFLRSIFPQTIWTCSKADWKWKAEVSLVLSYAEACFPRELRKHYTYIPGWSQRSLRIYSYLRSLVTSKTPNQLILWTYLLSTVLMGPEQFQIITSLFGNL